MAVNFKTIKTLNIIVAIFLFVFKLNFDWFQNNRKIVATVKSAQFKPTIKFI